MLSFARRRPIRGRAAAIHQIRPMSKIVGGVMTWPGTTAADTNEVEGQDSMSTERSGASLRHLHTLLSAGAIGALADGPLLERFLAGRGDADSSAAFAALVE